MYTVSSGQPAPMAGFYADDHGHRVLLRRGEPAPICRFSGAAAIRWRLLRVVPVPDRTR